MGERTRKRPRTFEDAARLMEAGGEGFIIDPAFRIKLGTQPILKDFKVRSYLNFMASLPMKYNPATKYFEFAETPEEITALCKAYFFSAEPGALADSGYDQFRINKARHLLVQPIVNGSVDGSGPNYYMVSDPFGNLSVRNKYNDSNTNSIWAASVVGVGGESPEVSIASGAASIGLMITVDAATTITVYVQGGYAGRWYEHTNLVFPGAGSKAQDVMRGFLGLKLKSSAAATITAELYNKII